jgi:DNA-binding beta-propeller fold protein YncE
VPAAAIAIVARRAAANRGEEAMSKPWIIATLLALLSIGAAGPATAFDRGNVQTFAVLPVGSSGPEGLTVGPDGNVYVTTFGFNAQGQVAGPSQLFVFAPNGQQIRDVAIAGATAHTLGLGFNPVTGDLLVIDFGAGAVLKVDPKPARQRSS